MKKPLSITLAALCAVLLFARGPKAEKPFVRRRLV